MGPTLPFSPPAAAVGAYLLIAAATGVAVRLRAHVYHKDLAGDDETAFHLRRLRGRGVLVGAALTVAVTAGFRVGTAAGDAFAEAVDAETGVAGLDDGTAVDTVAGVVGASAAYLVPIALVVLLISIVGIPLALAGAVLFGLVLWLATVLGALVVGTGLLSLADRRSRWGALALGVVVTTGEVMMS